MLAVAHLGGGNLEAGFHRVLILHYVLPVIWLVIPLAFCAICRGFGVQVKMATALTSSVLFLVSWPIAIFVRGLFEQLGSPDLIHALKSGFVIPFLVMSLGFPLLCRTSARIYRTSGASEEY